jgi:transcriptional activator protein UGA3
MRTIHFFPVRPMNITSSWLTGVVFLPMAVESPALLSAILAWSSIHLSCYNKSHELTAINHQSSALVALASSLRSKSPAELDTTLAACLVLCATDIAFGDTDRWYNHMKGARDIIVTAMLSDSAGRILTGPECFMQTKDGQWLLRNFAYHDVLASVTLAHPPLIRGAYWMREDEHIVDAYVGIGGKILALMSEIACLMEDENDAEQKTEIDIINQSLSLESQLLDWTPYPHPHAHDLLIELAESYRSTGLIYLYRQVRKRFPEGIDVIQDKIRTQVQETIRHVEKIPPESLPGCGILFPLFMAGGDATEEAHMQAIQARLQLLEQHRAFGNIKRARDVLEELWRLRIVGMKGHDGRPVDWLDVLQRKNWKLMLA